MFTNAEDKMLDSGPTWHGSAIFWPENIDKNISRLPVICERFCGVKYTDKETNTNILAYTAYLPTSGQDDKFLDVLSQLSYDIRNNLVENCCILIGLDSNQSEKSSRRRTDAMRQFNINFSLKTILQNDLPTFHHNNQTSASQIDHILFYIPEESDMKVTFHKHLCQLVSSENLSSHDAIVGRIDFPSIETKNEEPDFSHTYTPFTVSKPVWSEAGLDGYQNQSAQFLQNLVNQFDQPEFIPFLSEMFSKTFVMCAENNFEVKKPKKKSTKPKKTYFSTEHKNAYLSHERVCIEWRKQGRPKDATHPAKQAKLQSQQNLQRIAREEESLKAMQNHDDLMSTFKDNISQVCNKLRKIRGGNLKSVNIP